MRISYSYTANLERILNDHNHKVLNKTDSQCNYACSCKNPLKGENAVRKTLFKRSQLTLTSRQVFTSACARPSLESDMPIMNNILQAVCMKTTLSFRSMFAA